MRVAKIGRPPSKNPKSYTMTFHMTKDEYELLLKCADLSRKYRSEVVLEGIRKVYEEVKNN